MRQAVINGRSGTDGELRYTPNKTAVLDLSVAVNEKRGEAEETHWFRVTVFGRSAEILAPKVKKGVELFIVGNLATRKWKDKNNQNHEVTEIIGNRVRVVQNAQQASVPAEEGGVEL